MSYRIWRAIKWRPFGRKKRQTTKYHGVSDDLERSSPTNHGSAIRSLTGTLRVFGELLGAPAVAGLAQRLDENEWLRSARKDLEKYCDDFSEIVESVIEEKASAIPEELRNGLQRLHGTLETIHDELRDYTITVDVEAIARRIMDQSQLFMFEGYLRELETKSRVYERMEGHVLNQAIRDLPRTKAAYDDYVGDNRHVACFEGTRQGLLEEIGRWSDERDDTRTYLLFGIAGVGKSTVAQTVAQRAHASSRLGASFFFSRDDAGRRTAERFFATIAFQLCVYDKVFAQAIGGALTEERGATATTKGPREQLQALIVEPLKKISSPRHFPIVIVVDALDECNAEDATEVLTGLDKLVRELKFLKVILTMRPQPHLRYLLRRLGEHKVFHLQKINGTVVDDDIRQYLKHSLSQDQVSTRFPMLRREWAANDEEINSLVKVSGQLFIIASILVTFILDAPACNPRSRLEMLHSNFPQNRAPFNTLNGFYVVVLRHAVPLGCDRDIVERYQAVIGTIVLVKDSLPISALSNLIGMMEDDVLAVLEYLQSVISLEGDGVPRVYHKSFSDYITNEDRCQDTDLLIDPSAHHTRLATCCLRIMNTHLKRNILGLSGPVQDLDNKRALEEELLLADTLQQVIPAQLQYAIVYWATHLAKADFEDHYLAVELEIFIEKHLLHWLEALSWVCKINTVLTTLDAIPKPVISTYEILSEVPRLVSNHCEKIEQSALFTYYVVLSLKPAELLYIKYAHEIPLDQVGSRPCDVPIIQKKHEDINDSDDAFIRDCSQSRMTMCTVSNCIPTNPFASHSPTFVNITSLSYDFLLVSGLKNIAKRLLIAGLDDYAGSQLRFSQSGYMLPCILKNHIHPWSGVYIVAGLGHRYSASQKVSNDWLVLIDWFVAWEINYVKFLKIQDT